jgi:hypothetical protein
MPEKDQFANVGHIQVTESAANTLTYKKLETGISLFEKVAWILSRLEYEFIAVRSAGLAASGDYIEYGLSTSNNPSTISYDEPAMVDIASMGRVDMGTAGSGHFFFGPHTKDFHGLPGGGLIVPPNPLYAFIKGTSMGAAAVVDVRIFYTVKTLKAEEFWELVEARRIISST